MDVLGKLLISGNAERLDHDIEDPLCLLINLSLIWIESVSNLDLELLWDVLLRDLKILSRAKVVINVFSHEFVLERLLVFIGLGRLSFLLEDLLFDPLFVDLLFFDETAVDLLVV